MLDIYNHLAVFAALGFACTATGLSFISGMTAKEWIIIWCKVMIFVFGGAEALAWVAWSIWYLNGGAV